MLLSICAKLDAHDRLIFDVIRFFDISKKGPISLQIKIRLYPQTIKRTNVVYTSVCGENFLTLSIQCNNQCAI